MRLLVLLLALSGCTILQYRLVRLDPDVAVPHVVTCGDIAALGASIVDGRRAGQTRAEQRRLVDLTGIAAPFHMGLIDSVYDWPRPPFPSGWARLRAQTFIAASDHCLNVQGATLKGLRVPS